LTHAVSWHNGVLRAALPALDAADRVLCRTRGYSELPPFSARIRSTGLRGEFGGRKFVESGRGAVDILRRMAALTSQDLVLDIGCGAGRLAIALTTELQPGGYTGFDIDPVQIEACRQCEPLRRAGFSFVLTELQSDVYNRESLGDAARIRLPFPDQSFDLVFMGSVFTHLLADEVANYAQEIMRVLSDRGRCVFTAYLVGQRPLGPAPTYTLSHRMGDAWVELPAMPRLAVGYSASDLDRYFGRPASVIECGGWRNGGSEQDWLMYTGSAS